MKVIAIVKVAGTIVKFAGTIVEVAGTVVVFTVFQAGCWWLLVIGGDWRLWWENKCNCLG